MPSADGATAEEAAAATAEAEEPAAAPPAAVQQATSRQGAVYAAINRKTTIELQDVLRISYKNFTLKSWHQPIMNSEPCIYRS